MLQTNEDQLQNWLWRVWRESALLLVIVGVSGWTGGDDMMLAAVLAYTLGRLVRRIPRRSS